MTAGMFVHDEDEDEWVHDVNLKSSFEDHTGSPLLGSLSVPAPRYLNSYGALSLAESADRLIAWATAIRLRALARFEETLGEEPPPHREGQPQRCGGEVVHALAVAEVATSGAVSEAAAARLLHDAADLAGNRWAVLDALESGELSPAHARVILDQARTIPEEHAGAFSRTALQSARTRNGRKRTPAELRACLRRLREQLHPETIEARKSAAQRERGVWFAPEPDGMCTLTAHLPAETGLAIYTGLHRDAQAAAARIAEAGQNGEPKPGTVHEARALSQLRADALTQRLLGSGTDADPPPFHPEVIVTIPLELALGAEDGTGGGHTSGGQGTTAGDNPAPGGSASGGPAPGGSESGGPASAGAVLEGYGPIDAPTARRLASLAPTWHGLFTDAQTGAALGAGRSAYRPPRALRRYLAYRDGVCRFPGCTRPAATCEPDHTVEWQDGGPTNPDNLALLCRKHHALKSIDAWTYEQAENGTLQWCSPFGRAHTSEPAERGKAVHSSTTLSPLPAVPLFTKDPPDTPHPPDKTTPPGPDTRANPPPFWWPAPLRPRNQRECSLQRPRGYALTRCRLTIETRLNVFIVAAAQHSAE